MASIPLYQENQVRAQALPGARQQSIASPGLFNTNTATDAVGQGLQGLGDSMARHAAELQAKEDTATGTQLSADLMNRFTDYKLEARKRQGDMARGLPEEADKFFNDTVTEAVKNAPNDRVKQYLNLFAAQQKTHFYGYIAGHAAEQIDKAEDVGIQAHITSLKNAAAIDPSTADASLLDVKDAVRKQLTKKGITDPDAINVAMQEQATSFHAGVINTLMVNNPKEAMAYYGAHKDDISPDARVKMEKAIQQSNQVLVAQTGADELMSLVRNNAMTYAQAEAEARKRYSGEERNAVISELRSQKSEFEASKRDEEQALFDPVYKIVGDAVANGRAISRADMKATLTPLLSNPEAYKKAADMIDAHNDEMRSEYNAAADRAKALAGSGTDRALNGLQLKYDMISNPDKWRNADLRATLFPMVKDGTLRPGDVEEAINLQTSLRKGKKSPELATLMSAGEYLNQRLETAVIDGKEVNRMTTKEKALAKAQALKVLDPLVQEYQAQAGEKASPDEIKKLVDTIFVDKRYRNTFIGITVGGVKERTEVDLNNAPVRIKAQAVSQIPTPLRRKIETALRNNGYEVNHDNILEYYQAGGSTPLKKSIAPPTKWGSRPDGSAKGNGFLGVLTRPDGGVMTEYSVGVNINGSEMDIPTLVPTLSKNEIDTLLRIKDGQKIPDEIIRKATAFARTRIEQGKPVFALPSESPNN